MLYVKGGLTAKDKNSIALVGSRMSTHYGIETARKLAYQLAYLAVTIVSGGARGIDTAAHQGALSSKGRPIAVLGTGLNLVFPPENAELFERITANGAVMTQFPFNRPADKQSFPIRNRIVAGMTLGTVVVEANLTSGALITANFATESGRQIFAVPGRINSPRSKGCHELIKKGAKLCEGAEDVQAVVAGWVVRSRDPGTAVVFYLDADVVAAGVNRGSDGEGAAGEAGVAVQGGVGGQLGSADDHVVCSWAVMQ